MITKHLLSERPDLIEQAHALNGSAWPEPLYHGGTGEYWGQLFEIFLDYQIVFCEADRVIAVGHTIPVQWAGTLDDLPAGWDGVIERGVVQHEAGVVPNTLSALAAVIAPDYKGKGLSTQIIEAMGQVAKTHGFMTLIAPVRPNQKALYPLTAMERYLEWQTDKQAPFDAWIRTHWKMGATILKIAPQSMTIKGTVAEWEQWTGLKFPDGGEYVVTGMVSPVRIDRGENLGVYYDANVWMKHSIVKEQA
jgi:GNAT superfamily N-acetyltransferase